MKTMVKIKTAALVFFGLIALVLLWTTGINPYELVMAAWWPAIMVLGYSLALLWFAGISFGYILICIGLGASIVPLVTFLVQRFLNSLLSGSGLQRILSSDRFFGTIDLQAPLIAPITEELFKLLPVVLILIFLMRYKRYRLLSPIDFALLGMASGAGFDIFENLCRIYNDYYDVVGLYRSPVNEPIPAFLTYLFPSMIRSEYLGNPMVWVGHSGTTGAISLAAGYCIFMKRMRLLFLPIATYIISVFDHSMWNWYQPYPVQFWAKILPSLTIYGRLLPFLFLAGILVGAYLMGRQRARFAQELRRVNENISLPAGFHGRIKWFLALNRVKNQVANALRHYLIRGLNGEEFDLIVSRLLGIRCAQVEEK
jgi:RsiW-degrading membrane proteinase PrsW (M82 family)